MSKNGYGQAASAYAAFDGEVIGDESALRWFFAPREPSAERCLPAESREGVHGAASGARHVRLVIDERLDGV
jgi:hypothetical protein